jgi:transcriptional regulator with GAF, ATPase, and Fis domain
MQDLTGWRRQYAADIVGEAPRFVDALDNLRRVADTDVTIVLCGATGTGKDLFARAAHRASSRRGKPFFPVNCAAFQDSLLETELFGHVRGAFTGATQPRAGRFQAANGGTLFLDEIGELTLSAQAKLLRVLEDRVVTPVGSDSGVPVDVRIIAATHRDLEEMVRKGELRADLYYRISVMPIHLPLLRDRGDDLERITDVRVARLCERFGKAIAGVDKEARALLRAHSWPGNVRELYHCLERTVVLAGTGPITASDIRMPTPMQRHHRVEPQPEHAARAILSESLDLPPPMSAKRGLPLAAAGESETLDLRTVLEGVERQLIQQALAVAGGNRTEAAALLGLNRTTLVEKLRKYGV